MTKKTNSTRQPETEAHLLDQIMQIDAQETDARPAKRRSGITSRRVLAVCLVVLAALTTWNVINFSRVPKVVSQVFEEESARFHIYLVAQAIDDYRDSTRMLPASLDAIGADEDEISYEPMDSTYVLTAAVGPTRLTYRAGEDLSRYRDAYTKLLNEGVQ